MTIPCCSKKDCKNNAEWEIYYLPVGFPNNNCTHSCSSCIVDLWKEGAKIYPLTDYKPHLRLRIMENISEDVADAIENIRYNK